MQNVQKSGKMFSIFEDVRTCCVNIKATMRAYQSYNYYMNIYICIQAI